MVNLRSYPRYTEYCRGASTGYIDNFETPRPIHSGAHKLRKLDHTKRHTVRPHNGALNDIRLWISVHDLWYIADKPLHQKEDNLYQQHNKLPREYIRAVAPTEIFLEFLLKET